MYVIVCSACVYVYVLVDEMNTVNCGDDNSSGRSCNYDNKSVCSLDILLANNRREENSDINPSLWPYGNA